MPRPTASPINIIINKIIKSIIKSIINSSNNPNNATINSTINDNRINIVFCSIVFSSYEIMRNEINKSLIRASAMQEFV